MRIDTQLKTFRGELPASAGRVDHICQPSNPPRFLKGLDGSPKPIELPLPHVFVARIDDVRIVSQRGFVLTSDDDLFPFGVTHRNYAIIEDLAELDPRPSGDRVSIDIPDETQELEEDAIYIGGHSNFGHVCFEILPRLAVARKRYDIRSHPVVVRDTFPERHYGLLELAGVPRENIRVAASGRTLVSKRLIVPSCAAYRGYIYDRRAYIWPEGYLFLREMGLPFAAPPSGRRVYLSRAGAGWRRPANGERVEAALRALGFDIVVPETLSMPEQMRLMSECGLVVMPLGAAGIISVHLPPGAAVIELSTTNIEGTFGPMAVSALMGLRFHRLICHPVRHSPEVLAEMEGNVSFDPSRDWNYHVDIPELVRLVDLAERTAAARAR
jgi:capsular polysaccharide biosynthesis protein